MKFSDSLAKLATLKSNTFKITIKYLMLLLCRSALIHFMCKTTNYAILNINARICLTNNIKCYQYDQCSILVKFPDNENG